ncbi:ABC transporter permease [Xanthomonadaceae bacterium JHOS43]|nr:ABC transporter permease [Xanthomonadaceae bacterium JHOS43]MCX7562297.1 ABC transporter permease [Xanthomonadaceae bacterium XH05]
MKYLHLIWAQLFRSRTRTALTLLSVITAFMLFGLLDSVRVAFNSGGSVDGANRLVVASRLSITQTLPIRLLQQIEGVPGVRQATYAMWFGGIYQDMRNFFPNFSVAPNYFEVYTEYEAPSDQVEAFKNTRTAAAVGEALALKHGWKIGDTIPMQATIFPRDGSNDWPLQLTTIFKAKDRARAGEENQLVMNWSYFDEANDYIKNQVSWFTVVLDDPAQASQVAQAIDALSANSDHETKSQTESAFQQAFAKQFADIGLIVTAIMGAVFFTLVLLTGNTMAQAVRERVPELATLKTLGFTDASVLGLVLAESVLLVLLGGVLGIGLASIIVPALGKASGGMMPAQTMLAPQTWLVGLALMLAIGLVVGLLPALRAQRLKIVDALAGR